MNVRVKNSYNRDAEGTLITNTRDLTDTLLTSIVVKRGVTVLDILSTRMVGSYGFLSKAFDIFKQQEISVDMVATSECALSVTLDPDEPGARSGLGKIDSIPDARAFECRDAARFRHVPHLFRNRHHWQGMEERKCPRHAAEVITIQAMCVKLCFVN